MHFKHGCMIYNLSHIGPMTRKATLYISDTSSGRDKAGGILPQVASRGACRRCWAGSPGRQPCCCSWVGSCCGTLQQIYAAPQPVSHCWLLMSLRLRRLVSRAPSDFPVVRSHSRPCPLADSGQALKLWVKYF